MTTFRSAARVLASPSEAWLLGRMGFWAAVTPVLKHVLPLPQLVRLVAAPPRRNSRDLAEEQRVVESAARLYGSGLIRAGDNCLERSLVSFRFLARLNAEPRLLVGMSRVDRAVGHVWVLVDGDPVHDTNDTLSEFEPVVAFGPDGQRLDSL